MVVEKMKRNAKHCKGGLSKPFADVSTTPRDELKELVKLLARISADKDYNELLETSKSSYDGPEEKGPVL